MRVAIVLSNDPDVLRTDAGVLTYFPSADPMPDGSGTEGAKLTYRWVNPSEHSGWYRGEDWTEGLPYFREPEPKR